MTSKRRIVAAFLLGAGVVLVLVAVAAAAGLVDRGEPTVSASAVAALVAVFAGVGAHAGLGALRRAQESADRRREEFVDVARAEAASRLDAFRRSAGGALEGIGEALDGLARATEGRGSAAARLGGTAKSLREGVASRVGEIERLGQRVHEGAVAMARMERASGRALELINGLAVSIDQASLATREGDTSSRAIARDLDDLSSGVLLARSSLEAMKDGAEHACADARHVANTMASLALESQRIGETIEAVISGSDAALASNDRILDVTERLESRLGGIDEVIGVIRNLADRTKLLSINASIIATEAGEHGRAFAVVANEIKDLAGSTSRAIAEISTILSALEDGYADTVQAIFKSREDVDRGVSVARNAVEMIRSIPEQVNITSTLSNEIVMRTEDQVKKGVEIASMFEKMSAAIEKVGELLRQQVSRDQTTLEMYLAIGRSSEHVHRSTKEHAASSAEIVRVIDSVGEAFTALGRRVADDLTGADELLALSAEAEKQVEDLRRSALTMSSRLAEIVRKSRDVSLGEEKGDSLADAPAPRPETAA